MMNSCESPIPTTRASLAITTRDRTTIETLIAIATSKAIVQGITIREIADITNGVTTQVGPRRRGVLGKRSLCRAPARFVALKVGHARPLASQASAAKRRHRIGKIMDSEIIFMGMCSRRIEGFGWQWCLKAIPRRPWLKNGLGEDADPPRFTKRAAFYWRAIVPHGPLLSRAFPAAKTNEKAISPCSEMASLWFVF